MRSPTASDRIELREFSAYLCKKRALERVVREKSVEQMNGGERLSSFAQCAVAMLALSHTMREQKSDPRNTSWDGSCRCGFLFCVGTFNLQAADAKNQKPALVAAACSLSLAMVIFPILGCRSTIRRLLAAQKEVASGVNRKLISVAPRHLHDSKLI